jgi:hypothetical protein
MGPDTQCQLGKLHRLGANGEGEVFVQFMTQFRGTGTVWGGAAALAIAAFLGTDAQAASVLDLTTVGASGVINGATFVQDCTGPAGTGYIQSFVRIQANGTEQGYNTDFRPVQNQEKTDANFTRAVLLADVPVVSIGGVDYRQFYLDINESAAAPKALLSLDQLVLFSGTTNVLHDYDPADKTFNLGGSSTLLWDMDETGDIAIKLNANLQQGSGHFDMIANIPNSVFAGATGSYLYLYSQFGSNFTSSAGFEEWTYQEAAAPRPVPGPTPVPLPASVWAGMGLLGLVAFGQARRRAARSDR